MRKKVFICSPFRGDMEGNARSAGAVMGRHALLSASSSKRWLSCTPSARLEEQFKDEAGGSVYAEEGTAAHRLVFPVTAHDTVHDAVHACVHQLV